MTSPTKTSDLIKTIIDTHGGLSAWNSTTSITISFTFFGAALDAKNFPGTHHPRITNFPHAHKDPNSSVPWSMLTNLTGNLTDRMFFRPDRIWIETAAGKLLRSRDSPRDDLLSRPVNVLTTPWDEFDLAYFISYAMYNYISLPFSLSYPGFAVSEVALEVPHREAGETWRLLEVTHPDSWPTHTKVQRLYYGEEDHLLKRMDYSTDVLGGVAAHYVADAKRVGGLIWGTFRRVVVRVTAVEGGYDSVRDVPMLAKRSGFVLNFDEVEVCSEDGRVEMDVVRV